VINGHADFPEDPFWGDGKLYYAEYGRNRVSVWDGSTNRTLWTEDGCGPSAVMPPGDGMLALIVGFGSSSLRSPRSGVKRCLLRFSTTLRRDNICQRTCQVL
jgi:gluconolactonase